jgi:hypothetical protein
MSDIDILYPEGKAVTVQGESLVIKPYAFGQIAKVSKLAYPILKALSDGGLLKMATVDGKATLSIASDWMARIVEIMGIGGEELLSLVAFSTGKPRDWLDTIALDEGIELTKAIIEVNSDFFVKRILPMLSGNPTNPSDGDTSSANLSQVAIEEVILTPIP